jgi:hypothetical protein
MKGKRMKTDRLFLEKNCPDCAVVRAALVMGSVTEDDFKGTSGQTFHVFSSLSNEATKELLTKFDLEGKVVPILVTHVGDIIEKPGKINAYLQGEGMAEKPE